MGYSTDFYGCFTLDKPLSLAHAAYLLRFGKTRRMMRDVSVVRKMADPLRTDRSGRIIGRSFHYRDIAQEE